MNMDNLSEIFMYSSLLYWFNWLPWQQSLIVMLIKSDWHWNRNWARAKQGRGHICMSLNITTNIQIHARVHKRRFVTRNITWSLIGKLINLQASTFNTNTRSLYQAQCPLQNAHTVSLATRSSNQITLHIWSVTTQPIKQWNVWPMN